MNAHIGEEITVQALDEVKQTSRATHSLQNQNQPDHRHTWEGTGQIKESQQPRMDRFVRIRVNPGKRVQN
eukprot:201711-Karenia_brevis.AAC.1